MSVNNSVLFLGEQSLGTTAGAPLSTDSNNQLVSGTSNNEVSFSANITTTSATDVLLTGMTITPVAGTYLVIFSTWLTHSNGNATIPMSLYVGGVQKADSIRTAIPFVGALSAITQDMPLTINGIVTVNGSQAIAIEWHTSTGTATAHHGTLNLLRVA